MTEIVNTAYVELYPLVTSFEVQPFSHKMHSCAAFRVPAFNTL